MDGSRILDLVDEVIESGRSPEDVCAACPDALPEVRRRVVEYRLLERRLDTYFPVGTGSPHDPAPGDRGTLPDPPGYSVVSVLGTGGMGAVYLARHLELGRNVALKMLLNGRYAGTVERARFLREARSLATLRHPNIVSVFDVGEWEGRPYFTMEYVEGGTLADKLAGAPRAHEQAVRTTLTLALAVSYAHRQGIVHRDLKPANILLGADGSPKISDFGIARLSQADETLTLDGSRLGTPSYMSPEQAAGKACEIGPATDVYALGAILYELLTGRPPFRGATPAETERQVLDLEPLQPRALTPSVPRDVETICLRCLQKSPARRYGSADELADDLERFLQRRPIRARPVGPLERACKWVRRRPSYAAAWVSGVATVGMVLGGLLWTASQREAMARAISEDLAETVRLERAAEWRAARNMLERAKTRLAAGAAPAGLAQRVADLDRELELVDRLAAMRLDRAASRSLEFDRASWWRSYREAFALAGLLDEGDTAEAFAARVAASPARRALVDALDDWSVCATTVDEARWVLAAARAADPDPVWRDRARDIATWGDADAIAALAREAAVEREPVALLLTIAGLHSNSHWESGVALLRRTQSAHPSDFWANFALGQALADRGHADATAFLHAAIALRPEAAAAHVSLANALGIQSRTPEAIEAMRHAVALDGESVVAQYNLAVWLFREEQYGEAAVHAGEAARIDPTQPLAHGILGSALLRLEKHEDAAAAFRRAIDLLPEGHERRASFGRALQRCEEALAAPAQSPAP